MGNCLKKPKDETREEYLERKRLEKMVNMKQKNTIKILLLGPAESGKSTILKQLQLQYGNGFDDHERIQIYREVIYSNVIVSLRAILIAMDVKLNLHVQDHNRRNKHAILSLDPQEIEQRIFTQFAPSMISLWKDPAVQMAASRRTEYYLNDSAFYYLNKIGEIAHPNYIPSNSDILHSRVRTIGVNQHEYQVGKYTYLICDVGGQVSERRHWVEHFDNVTAIIFLVALSDYDQTMEDDPSKNRLEDSLELFEMICNSKWFQKSSIILFLNKVDVFGQKISSTPLELYFPEFDPNKLEGSSYFRKACRYLQTRFEKLNMNPSKRTIYTKFTTAVREDIMQQIISNITDTILTRGLQDIGLF